MSLYTYYIEQASRCHLRSNRAYYLRAARTARITQVTAQTGLKSPMTKQELVEHARDSFERYMEAILSGNRQLETLAKTNWQDYVRMAREIAK